MFDDLQDDTLALTSFARKRVKNAQGSSTILTSKAPVAIESRNVNPSRNKVTRFFNSSEQSDGDGGRGGDEDDAIWKKT